MQLGSVMLHGYAEMPDPFAGLAVSAVNGWRGLPGARGDSDPIPGAHGNYGSTRVLREQRSIEVRGAAIAASEFEALAMIDALEAELAGSVVEMWVSDAQGAWRRTVEVETVQIVGAYNHHRVRFAVDAIAPDPRRYRAVQTAGPVLLPVHEGGLVLPLAFPWNFGNTIIQQIALNNTGQVPLLPVIRLDGAADAVTVRGGPRRIEFGEFSGSLTFDVRERRAHLNGADVTRWMLRRDWPVVAAGDVSVFYFEATNPSTDLQMTVDYEIGAW